MASELNSVELLGRCPDERLLTNELSQLPETVGQPEPLPPDAPARRRVVAIGATLTGVTLLLGIGLIAAGIGEAASNAFALAIALLVAGLAFVGTHWGWVHVAEITGNALQTHRNAPTLERRRAWLAQIEPYVRWEVSTSVQEDGSIAIVTYRYRPVPSGERSFTFVRDEVARESHPADEPAAAVTERAELLRRQAHADTEEARAEFETADGAYQQALMARDDEQQRRIALRAASEALSERINANLRDPPLTE